tara:strand:- start:193 stop:405 length:213 start_codon:yes stop_codon:yes gene_type:complete
LILRGGEFLNISFFEKFPSFIEDLWQNLAKKYAKKNHFLAYYDLSSIVKNDVLLDETKKSMWFFMVFCKI